MNKIKFSHRYSKWVNELNQFAPKYATLIQLFVCDYKDLYYTFIEYDTEYCDDEACVAYYKLPKTKLIVLLFDSLDSPLYRGEKIWTTIRRWTPQKEKYYRYQIGEEFEVEVVSE